jgi:hypothetical protein
MVWSLLNTLWNFFSNAIEILYFAVSIRVHRFLDYLQTVFRYYFNARFRKADRLLIAAYLFSNPYRISRQFLQRRGEREVYAYGETPLTTLEWIATRCKISAADTVYELGMGRGRTCFWLRSFVGCRVVGIEYISTFVAKAQAVALKAQVEGIEFRCEDYLHSHLQGATVCYLYGSNLDEEVIRQLVQRLALLPSGTRFITVSFPLSDYTSEPLFQQVDQFPALFLWGTATVYLETRI